MSERSCSDPPVPGEVSHAETRRASHIDSASAHRGLAELVFRVRAAVPTDHGDRISAAAVVMQDTLSPHLPPLGAVVDSTGVAVISVPVGYTAARVQRIGYATYTLPVAVRPGRSDTIIVALARTRVCLVE
jgi:hypothetical protein